MKTTLLVTALFALTGFAASACPYSNVSAQADKPMTVASADAAKSGQQTVTPAAGKEQPKPAALD